MQDPRGRARRRSPSQRWRRPVSVAALLAAVGALLSGAPLVGGTTRPAAAATDTVAASVKIRIDSVTPETITGDSVVTVTGALINQTAQRFRQLQIRLQGDDPVHTRAGLHQLERSPEAGTTSAQGPAYPHTCRFTSFERAGALGPKATRAFAVSCPAKDLGLSSPGVYPLLVNLNAKTPTIPQARIGEGYTVLPYTGGIVTRPAQVNWLWPITGAPSRVVGSIDDPATPVFGDDHLAKAFARGGRLYSLVSAARNKPPPVHLTLAIDPDILESAAAMANTEHPYLVQPSTGSSTKGTGTRAAARWLAMLRSLTRAPNVTVAALPYADPDLVALTRQPESSTPILSDAFARAPGVMQRLLGVPNAPVLAWPADGVMDSKALRVLAVTQANAFVLDAAALPTSADAIPGAAAKLPSTVGERNALVSDSSINALIAPRTFPTGQGVSVQEFKAELALIATARPKTPRTVFAVPPRSFGPYGYTQLLMEASVNPPYSRSISYDGLLHTAPVDRGSLRYPRSVAVDELPADMLQQTYAAESNLADFQTAVKPADASTYLTNFYTAALRTTSGRWRGDPDAAQQITSDLQVSLQTLRGRVKVEPPSKGIYSLSSTSGRLVVTVDNQLNYPVTVRVTATPKHQVGFRAAPVVQQIGAHAVVTVRVPTTVESSGRFQAYLELHTPGPSGAGGQPLGANTPPLITVRSTAYGAVSLVITGGALLLLLILMSRRLYGRFHHREPPGAAASAPGGPPDGPAGGPHDEPRSALPQPGPSR
ncbi:MAG: DUF6049 family protein [Mycobacteriales bacterium]